MDSLILGGIVFMACLLVAGWAAISTIHEKQFFAASVFSCFSIILIVLTSNIFISSGHNSALGYPATIEGPYIDIDTVYEVVGETRVPDRASYDYYVFLRTPASDIHKIKAGPVRIYKIVEPLPPGTNFVIVDLVRPTTASVTFVLRPYTPASH